MHLTRFFAINTDRLEELINERRQKKPRLEASATSAATASASTSVVLPTPSPLPNSTVAQSPFTPPVTVVLSKPASQAVSCSGPLTISPIANPIGAPNTAGGTNKLISVTNVANAAYAALASVSNKGINSPFIAIAVPNALGNAVPKPNAPPKAVADVQHTVMQHKVITNAATATATIVAATATATVAPRKTISEVQRKQVTEPGKVVPATNHTKTNLSPSRSRSRTKMALGI